MSTIQFSATILKFGEQGEKTGWTYIEISSEKAQELKPNCKKSFRVKGFLDTYPIQQTALIPIGDGNFILPLNATMRKGFGKRKGAQLQVQLAVDESPLLPSVDLTTCLEDEPKALQFFKKLTPSHQHYFSKWIDSAKTESTKAKRISQALNALSTNRNFPEMLRALKAEKNVE
jgi:hypothetical protein